jgi:hypothetical protein
MLTISDIDRYTVIENTRITRRSLLLGAASATGLVLVGRGIDPAGPALVTATQPSPHAAPAAPTDDGVDVPVLELGFLASGVTASAEVPAGTVRVLATMDGSEDFGSLIFRVPDGVAVEEALAIAGDPEAGVPEWIFDAYLPGGIRTDLHEPATAEGFIVLEPGTYVVADFATGSAAAFTATGAAAAPVEIPADIHVVAEDSMTFAGLEAPVPTGRHLWRLENGGALYHNIFFLQTIEGATAEDVLGFFQSMDSATPAPEVITGGGWMSTAQMSAGASTWFYLDLPPGSYAALCSASDSFAGPPHFFMGMIETFTVA